MALLIRRVIACAVAAAAALGVVRPACVRAQSSVEQEVKAAFLYNFTKFVEWPDGPSTEPFRVCVVADAAFTRVFDQIIQGELVNGRQLVRADLNSPEAARGCQILYVGQQESERAARLLAAVRQAPVLTVGEAPRFVPEGGAIQFVLENNRVRFDISVPAIERSGLKVSSKLLRVARHVQPGGVR